MAHAQLFLWLAVIFAFFMAVGVGANDVANAMGTSVGSKVITLRNAVIIAAVFESLGALLAGGQVTETIRSKIIDVHLLTATPEIFIYGMLASLLAAATWLVIATKFGRPVSTAQSIIGSVIGFALIVLGAHTIYWGRIVGIMSGWVVTPTIAGILSYFLFRSVQWLIFNSDKPIQQAKRYVPFYIFIGTFVTTAVTLLSGLQHIGIQLSHATSLTMAFAFSILVAAITRQILNHLHFNKLGELHADLKSLEKIFSILMVFTACATAFALGANDVANAIGPLAAIEGIVHSGGQIMGQSTIPFWVLLLGAMGMVFGLSIYGYKVIATVGTTITELTPARGFAAQLACASTVLLASGLGLPVSTGQTLVGAVLGIGFARGIGALNLVVVRDIFFSWVITLPAGAAFAIIYYYMITFLVHHL